MRDHVLLYVNGCRHEIRGRHVFQSLSDFLRNECRLTGTKIVCAEGDCGSCAVLIGRPNDDDSMTYVPVTSCIQFLPQLDGTHVISVEGLRTTNALHPAQQAMVDHHGAQCGFCTPGMMASLCSLLDGRTSPPTRAETTRALVGNLCRCTGYDSIITAAAQIDLQSVTALNDLYPAAEMRSALRAANAESIQIVDADRQMFKPATLAEALDLKALHPDATILAGGTDLGVLWNKGKRPLTSLICLGQIAELRDVQVTTSSLVLGAATTLTQTERIVAQAIPEYARMLERFGSPPIKNAGTIGGNLANGSPIGDTLPGLFVLNAVLELASRQGTRRININDFYTGYRKNVLRPHEIVTRVEIPLPDAQDLFFTEKISKRRDLDISSFAAAIWLRVEGNIIRSARVAYGGVAATVVRLPRTEDQLIGQEICEATFQAAGRIARDEVKPISDVRGSANYRSLLAENVLIKFGRCAAE